MGAMTKEEFAREMQDIVDKVGWDIEKAHSQMDDLMCQMLRELGYDTGVDIFEVQEKWCA